MFVLIIEYTLMFCPFLLSSPIFPSSTLTPFVILFSGLASLSFRSSASSITRTSFLLHETDLLELRLVIVIFRSRMMLRLSMLGNWSETGSNSPFKLASVLFRSIARLFPSYFPAIQGESVGSPIEAPCWKRAQNLVIGFSSVLTGFPSVWMKRESKQTGFCSRSIKIVSSSLYSSSGQCSEALLTYYLREMPRQKTDPDFGARFADNIINIMTECHLGGYMQRSNVTNFQTALKRQQRKGLEWV